MMYTYVGAYVAVGECLERVGLFLYCMGTRDCTQVIRLVANCLYLYSHLLGPGLVF